jgi:hypothetical protein
MYLQVSFRVKEQVLWLDIAVRDALAVQVGEAVENLLEAAFDFARAHSSVDDIVSNLTTWTDECRNREATENRQGTMTRPIMRVSTAERVLLKECLGIEI